MILNMDLNDVHPESREQDGTSATPAAQQEVQPSQPAVPTLPIDIEAIAEAKNNSRRNRGRMKTWGRCPTCRREVTMKDAIRVYLPAAS